MPKRILTLVCLSVSCYASPLIITNPVPVTGSGDFSYTVPDLVSGGAAHGNSGTDYVYFGWGSDDLTSLLPCGTCYEGTGIFGGGAIDAGLELPADIDGIFSHYYSVYVDGDAGGELTLYNDSNEDVVIASAPLIGYVTTSYTIDMYGAVDGTVTINPTPEPATLLLAAMMTVGLAARRRRFSAQQRPSK